jgi:hypothetical protein
VRPNHPYDTIILNAHNTFTLGLSCSPANWSLWGPITHMTQLFQLTLADMWNLSSLIKAIQCKKWLHFDRHNKLSSELFRTTCSLYGLRCRLFWRILWTHICGINISEIAWKIDFFGIQMSVCLTQYTLSSDLPGHLVQCFFSTLRTSDSSCHVLMTVLSDDVTLSEFTMNTSKLLKICYHNMACAFSFKATTATVQMAAPVPDIMDGFIQVW